MVECDFQRSNIDVNDIPLLVAIIHGCVTKRVLYPSGAVRDCHFRTLNGYQLRPWYKTIESSTLVRVLVRRMMPQHLRVGTTRKRVKRQGVPAVEMLVFLQEARVAFYIPQFQNSAT